MQTLVGLSGAKVDLIHRKSKNILKKGANGTNNKTKWKISTTQATRVLGQTPEEEIERSEVKCENTSIFSIFAR